MTRAMLKLRKLSPQSMTSSRDGWRCCYSLHLRSGFLFSRLRGIREYRKFAEEYYRKAWSGRSRLLDEDQAFRSLRRHRDVPPATLLLNVRPLLPGRTDHF